MNNHLHHLCNRLSNNALYLRLLRIAGGIIVLSLFAHWFDLYIPRIEIWIKSLGALAPLAFILLFVLGAPFLLSVDALCLAAGVLFPLTAGVIYAVISTYLAAVVIFILGRYLVQDKAKVLLARHPKLVSLDNLLSDNGFRLMFLLRLLPLPFAVLSYAFSVTQVQFKPYIISTSGILIYNLALVYFGYTAKHIASLGSEAPSTGSVNYPLLVVGLIVILFILAMLVKTVRNTLAQIAPEIVEL